MSKTRRTCQLRIDKLFFMALFSFFIASEAMAVERHNVTNEGVSLHGYDPVAYFSATPAIGSPQISHVYEGVEYNFRSKENLSAFIRNPNKYAPQFGGYCAYGVRVGKKLDIDPNAFEVVDGKLYVLLNRATKKIWEMDKLRNIEIGERLWQSIKDTPVAHLGEKK